MGHDLARSVLGQLGDDQDLLGLGGRSDSTAIATVFREIPHCDHPSNRSEQVAQFSTVTDRQMSQLATLDTDASLFFYHRDPAMVSWLGDAGSTDPVWLPSG
ncbi:hypothetical protein ACQCSX_06495 [Pseudarthrobacter sp. P1]|uniref:hypothetical protein n=1 Tax=Pseudarthrobacter sp. P1 TaxID=3418418 RepID=UPI003CE80FAD